MGFLMWLAWPPNLAFPLAFVAFLPLFIADRAADASANPTRTARRVATVAFFTFNLVNVWWVGLASELGAGLAVVGNTFFMATTFLVARRARLAFGPLAGYVCFILFWLAFEYLHMRWGAHL